MSNVLKNVFIKYLDCPCRYFEPMLDDNLLMDAYHEAQSRSIKEGFIPVIVVVNETLMECLIMNSDKDYENSDNYSFNKEQVNKYRESVLNKPLFSGVEVLNSFLADRKLEAEDGELEWENDIIGAVEGGEPSVSFMSYWDFATDNTYPLILAEIPVKNSWEIFAWLPFGGWNECPDTLELMSVAKYWYEKHGAVPAVMSHDVLEFDLSVPVKLALAKDLAVEQYAWCPDLVNQGGEEDSVGKLADTLRQSTKWYFWWD